MIYQPMIVEMQQQGLCQGSPDALTFDPFRALAITEEHLFLQGENKHLYPSLRTLGLLSRALQDLVSAF